MAIDTGVGATYNENFPVRGVDQPSQGFRDNFTVIKRAIENLQTATNTTSSVLAVNHSLSAEGQVFTTLSFLNNAFIVPSGSPSVTPSAGMLRYAGVPQFHDGTGWRTVVTTDSEGGVEIPSTAYLKLPTGASETRPLSGEEGMLRFNTTLGGVEVYTVGGWKLVNSAGQTGDGTFATLRVTGTLTVDQAPTDDTDAVNLFGLRTYATALLGGPHANGISVIYGPGDIHAAFVPRTFNVNLHGAVTGSMMVSNLQDIEIETVLNPDLGVSIQDVRDEIGSVVQGSIRDPDTLEESETGIQVYYDQNNATLSLVPRDFTITLAGDVTGSGLVHYLGNTTITTTANFLKGLSIRDEGTPVGTPNTAKVLDFRGNGVTATQTGDTATVTVTGLSLGDVRDEVGSFIRGTVRDPNTEQETESGISVYYDAVNNTLSLSPRTFSITLSGAVTGTATITRLNSVTMVTSADFLKGLTAFDEGNPLVGTPQTVQEINFIGNGVSTTQVGSRLNVTIPQALTLGDVRDEVGGFIRGSIRDPQTLIDTETGILTYYDASNNTLSIAPRDFKITLAGAVRGNAVVHYLGNTTITTEADYLLGLNVQNEGTPTGAANQISTLNFIGTGVTAVQVGNTASISINSLSTLDIQNQVGNLIRGTIRDPQTLAETESGIAVFYDAANNTISVAPRTFSITLTGAVTGTGTVSRLNNVSIATSSNYITGLTGYNEDLLTGGTQTIQAINFVGGGVDAIQSGSTLRVNIPTPLAASDIRDEVGTFVRGSIRDPQTLQESETGILVFYDQSNNTLSLAPRDFTITLTGDVTGTATVHYLGNTTINTSTNFIEGLTTRSSGTATGAAESVRNINFTGPNVTTTQVGNTTTVSVSALSQQDVQDQVGSLIRGTIRDPQTLQESETGIFVYYDQSNNTISLAPRAFKVTLAGAVTGNATVTSLNDITITTSSNYITGLTAFDGSNQLGLAHSVKQVVFTGGAITATQSGDILTVDAPILLTNTDVRDEVGGFIRGTSRDPNTNLPTETGITVNYDDENNVLELGAREFDITLTGAVTGTARVVRLNSVQIATSSNFIEGMTVKQGGVLQGTKVKELNVVGGTATVANGVATISVASGSSPAQVKTLVRDLMIGDRGGIQVTYDSSNEFIKMAIKPLQITLAGAVTGNGTMLFDGSADTGKVTIVTESFADRGVEVRDEGTTAGTAVTSINFVGGGVTSAVSVDGEIATVYIPNSPANEKFLLIDNGSANVPNARKLTAGVGITINDGGPGGNVTISAQSDEILGNTQFLLNGVLIGERPSIDVQATDEIFPEFVDDAANGKVVLKFYSLNDGWHRQDKIDFGSITDKYGASLDMGTMEGGIIEADINLGSII